jgi:hypothetical protein
MPTTTGGIITTDFNAADDSGNTIETVKVFKLPL